nr:MAG TPA: hypothetical protein [Caudoviricetes sp.]
MSSPSSVPRTLSSLYHKRKGIASRRPFFRPGAIFSIEN